VCSKGADYEGYSAAITRCSFGGDVIDALDMNDVTQLMETMGISTQHRLLLKATFTGWKKSPGAAFEALASAKVAHVQHMAPLQLCDVRLQAAAADKALQQKAEKEAAAAKKKQEEAAAAQKKALEEAAAAKKKQEEAAAAQKKAQEDAAAAAKKKQDEAAAAKKKQEEAAAAKKKQDEAAAAQALAQRKVRFVPPDPPRRRLSAACCSRMLAGRCCSQHQRQTGHH
jgi:membrane protein involved in colicin uptake